MGERLALTKIRAASPADRTFVLDVARRLASFPPPAWRSRDEIVGGEARTLEAFFAEPPTGSALLIAESEGGDRLGFAYLERLQDYFTREAHGHLGMLAVTEQAAGQGIGSALIRAAESWAREQGFRHLTLTVFETNDAARAVYEHMGYMPETLRYVKIL
jgi:GNAT superfamily N-acetyltransferase